VDEKSGIQALDRSQPVLPMMPGVPKRRSHGYVCQATNDLFAAFNITDGTVISQMHRHHRAAEFKTFLAQIDKAVPVGLGVHLARDNLATRKAPHAGLAGPPPGSACLHHDRIVVDQPGRTLVRGPDPPRESAAARVRACRLLEAASAPGSHSNQDPGPSDGSRPPTRSWTHWQSIKQEF
jgi:hypothetical protein